MMLPTSRSFYGKLIRLPLRLVPKGLEVPIIQGPLKGMKWIVGSSDHGCWLGLYEKAKVQCFVEKLKSLQSHAVVYDFGAHVGYYSMIASKYVPDAGIHAFEPAPENIKLVNRHISINSISNVIIHEGAIGEREEEVMFDFGHSSTTGKVSNKGKTKVHQYCIDIEVKAGRLPPPNLIKMDIEGAEHEALRGAEQTIRTFHPIIFLATHSPSIHRRCIEFLKVHKYALSSIDGGSVDSTDEILAL